jgi:hypothetical protein
VRGGRGRQAGRQAGRKGRQRSLLAGATGGGRGEWLQHRVACTTSSCLQTVPALANRLERLTNEASQNSPGGVGRMSHVCVLCVCISPGRPRQGRAYIPDPAFSFDGLIADGRLIVAQSYLDPAVQKRIEQSTQSSTAPVQAVFITSSIGLLSAWQQKPYQQSEAQSGITQAATHALLSRWGENPHATLVICRDVLGMPLGTDAEPPHTRSTTLSSVLRQMHPQLCMRVVEVDTGKVPTLTQLTHLLEGLPQMPGQVCAPPTEAGTLKCWAEAGGGRVAVHSYTWLQVVRVQLPPHTLTAMASEAVTQAAAWRRVGGDGGGGAHVLAGRLEAALKVGEV